MNNKDILKEHINADDFKTYYIGFNSNEFDWDSLINLCCNNLVDFILGFHEGVIEHIDDEWISEALESLYTPEIYDESIHNKGKITDEHSYLSIKYRSKGEWGELLLHIILRTYLDTLPLNCKLYINYAVKKQVCGYDIVHISKDMKTLFLGEAKMYMNGEDGVKKLIEDLKGHYTVDFLTKQITPIYRNTPAYFGTELPKDLRSWRSTLRREKSLRGLIDRIKIPMICVYDSSIYQDYNEVSNDFKSAYEKESILLKETFDNMNDLGIPLETILVLLPLPSKYELIRKIHIKIKSEKQRLGIHD
tara:strand:+ start:3370 stop:4284 length:915 start_codon:yes stop_codon:yes gene_type:complete